MDFPTIEKPDFLSADFVVIDEYSMVDMKVTYALFQRLKPGVQILFVGGVQKRDTLFDLRKFISPNP